jgi:DNA (cytosine-5)-methyltransferase 1
VSNTTQYLSLFSGIGGLEMGSVEPRLLCERDADCRIILKQRHPAVPVHDDVFTLNTPPSAEIVAGGWPCQDLSIAGRQTGLSGTRSGLFFEMLRVARQARAHTLVGENVPNLISINGGIDFDRVLSALTDAGYKYVAWRVLNARAFGLPQERRRLFIVASRHPERAWALHARLPQKVAEGSSSDAYGFYWTGGKRSICFAHGYVPTLKVGAADEKGRAPVAVLMRDVVRKLSTSEFLRLQGFDALDGADLRASALLKMAGNAVALPVGRFVMNAVAECLPSAGLRTGFGRVDDAGFYDDGIVWMVQHETPKLASNLDAFLDEGGLPLSAQACAGLIVRSMRSGQRMPLELFDRLLELTDFRPAKIHPSRADSFQALDSMRQLLEGYRNSLLPVGAYEQVV